MLSEYRIIETINRVAPLGVRFWDRVAQAPVGEGLLVVAYPQGQPQRKTVAFPNRSGVYVFNRLPGLADFSLGDGDAEFWNQFAPHEPFTVEVRDGMRRFQPFAFTADVPFRGIFQWSCPSNSPDSSPAGSPLDSSFSIALPRVPLFSAPTRQLPPDAAIIRADLRLAQGNQPTKQPASWSALEVFLSGAMLGQGLADQQGRVVVVFPYPTPLDNGDPSGAPSAQLPPYEQSWNLELRVHYDPTLSTKDLPDLCHALTAPYASLLGQLEPNLALGDQKLEFGKPMIVQTDSYSELYLSTAG